MKKTGKLHTREREEAERIYRAIFRTPIPSDVRDRYYKATHTLFTGYSPEKDQAFAELLRNVSDLEALEIAARRKNKIPRLVNRFQLMVHLAENLPANQRIFVNSYDQRISGFFSLGLGSVRTLYKFVKGCFLLRRAGDV